MSGIGSGFDLNVTSFSPEGRIFQLEYAEKAASKGNTVIGIRCRDGIVLGAENLKTSKLIAENTDQRLFNVENNIGIAICGLISDGMRLLKKACEEAKEYRNLTKRPISSKNLSEKVAFHTYLYTMYPSIRPYGVFIILGSWTPDEGSRLFAHKLDASVKEYSAVAFGRFMHEVTHELEKLELKTITAKNAIYETIRILYSQKKPGDNKIMEIELSWISEETKGKYVSVSKKIINEFIKKLDNEFKDLNEP